MSSKGIILGLALAAFAVPCVVPTITPVASANVLPGQEVWRYYYSNSSMTTQVGTELVTSCYGVEKELFGTRTSHYVSVSQSCDGGGGSGEVDCFVNGVLTTCPPSICDSPLFEC